jgi:hypothetical protein
MVDLEGDREKAPKTAAEGSSGTIPVMIKKHKKTIGAMDQRKIEKNLQQMAAGFNQRKESDNLIFASIREELDFMSKRKTE